MKDDIDKNSEQPDHKTASIIEAANLGLELYGLKKRTKAIDERLGELAFILMTIEKTGPVGE